MVSFEGLRGIARDSLVGKDVILTVNPSTANCEVNIAYKEDLEDEDIFNDACSLPTDINKQLKILRKFGEKCEKITEFGVRKGISTIAWLVCKPKKLISYDIKLLPETGFLKFLAAENKIDFTLIEQDTLSAEIEQTDLLFIDTFHSYTQLKQELALHMSKVNKCCILHDTASYKIVGEDNKNPGIGQAIDEFLSNNKNWKVIEETSENCGLMVLEKV